MFRRVMPGEVLIDGDEYQRREEWASLDKGVWAKTGTPGQILEAHTDLVYRRTMLVVSPPIERVDTEDSLRLENYLESQHEIEKLRIANPYGYGLRLNGTSYTIGYTGKEKPLPILGGWSTNARIHRLYRESALVWVYSHGDEIHEVFDHCRPGSCMGEGKSGLNPVESYRQFYVLNPDVCGVISSTPVLSPLLQSRCSALYWVGRKRVYLDRIYGAGYDSLSALQNAMIVALKTRYPSKDIVCIYIACEGHARHHARVTFLLNNHFGRMPYCDSLCHATALGGKMRVSSHSSPKSRECRSTQGTYFETSETSYSEDMREAEADEREAEEREADAEAEREADAEAMAVAEAQREADAEAQREAE